jgi:phospholipase/carboxylesterase
MRVVRNGMDFSIIPEVHRRTLVWIHGFGDTGELFCDDFAKDPLVPDCKVLLPTAEERSIESQGGQKVHAWYTRFGYDYTDTIEPSVARINAILEEESRHTDCLMLGGFSQGAVLSLLCGLSRFSGPISAIIALSGFALSMQIPETKRQTPVLLYHGAQDNRIPLAAAQRTVRERLEGCNYTFEVHPTMPHEVYLDEYEFIRRWLKVTLNI